MTALDPRLLSVGVEIGGQLRIYSDGDITANIAKSGDPIQNESTITIGGMAQEPRNQLLTETSPYNKNYVAKRVTVSAGRQSTGTFTIYSGDITRVELTQPPNIIVTLHSKTLNFQKSILISKSFGESTPLSVIAKGVASVLGIPLNFQATDRNIGSFAFTGPQTGLVDKLGEMGGVNAYVDDSVLVVKNNGVALTDVTHTISEASGMIGQPELTDIGVRVRYMLDQNSKLGGKLTIDSKQNPTLSGDYIIYNLWDVVALRDTAWYTVADCMRPGRIDTLTGFPLLLK